VAWTRGSRAAHHALHDPVRRKAILYWILGIAAAAVLLRAALKAMAQSIARKQYTRELVQKNRELQELIEEVNRTQQQLIHSEKLAGLGQLVAGIAHELNNPIGFIYANLCQIRKYIDGIDPGALDERGRATLLKMDQALRESQEGSIRIRDIVQNLRGLSRAGNHAGKGPGHGLQKKPCDLNLLLDKSLLLAQTSFSKNIVVEKDYAALPPVEADETQIQQVFLNILVNAGQALGEKGRIRLRTRVEGEGESARAAVSIADDGPGIGPEQLKHIFEPFFTTKPVGQGIGLGLHICYEIVSAHQGAIEARSEPGKGAEFLIKLPSGSRIPNPPAAAPAAGVRAGRNRLQAGLTWPSLSAILAKYASQDRRSEEQPEPIPEAPGPDRGKHHHSRQGSTRGEDYTYPEKAWRSGIRLGHGAREAAGPR
jgi:signal transduction histidine kinase